MSTAFDTLAFTKRLEVGGVGRNTAEAHAEAIRDLVMRDLVIKADLTAAVDQLDAKIDAAVNTMTIRLGAIVAAGIGVLGAVIAFF